MALRIYLLGPLRIDRDGRPLPERIFRTRQERRLLATVPASRLIDWLWPGSDTAAATLRSAISHLRRTLDSQSGRASHRLVATRVGGYAWGRPEDVWVDMEEFLAVAPAEQTPSEEELARAVGLYRGDLLEDEADLPWVFSLRNDLRERFLVATELLVEYRLQSGAYHEAAHIAQRALAFDPLREPVCRMLMRSQAMAGDIAAALQSYERFRLSLNHELGASPSTQTQALHSAILRGEIAPEQPPREHSSSYGRMGNLPLNELDHAPLQAVHQLLGRKAEIAQLRAWIAALEQHGGGVVTLVGEAGIGKSRLLAEIVNIAEASGAQTLTLRCTRIEQGLPFGTLAEALRPLARHTPAALFQYLPRISLAQLAELIPALRERVPELPELPALPPAESRSRLVDGVAELALALARVAPLVVCCDDTQWADDALLATIGRLARQAPRRALLLVLAYRPEELSESPALHAVLRDLGREMLLRPLLIGPLDDDAAIELVAGPPQRRTARVDQIARRLAALSGGNPLMLSTIAQALLDSYRARSLAELPADFELHAPLPTSTTPIREIVAARLERLPEPARTLLEQIALLGRPASLDLIETLGGSQALGYAQLLLDRQLLTHVGDERLDLPHDAVRATVILLIGPPKRRLLHHAIAQSLMALHGSEPERAAEIASHLSRAGLGLDSQLLHYALAAGDRALQTHGYTEAIRWYDTVSAAAARLDKGRTEEQSLQAERAAKNRVAALAAQAHLQLKNDTPSSAP
jgi:DNA-binding SARP family transcriptional activator